MRPLFLWLLIALAVVHSAAWANEMTAREITAARKIYVVKCAKCHRFYEPTAYGESDWGLWMEKMNKKSKLKGEQASLLNRYLDLYRAGRLPGKPQDKLKLTAGGTAAR